MDRKLGIINIRSGIVLVVIIVAYYFLWYIPHRDQVARLDVKTADCTKLGMQRVAKEKSEADEWNSVDPASGHKYYNEQRYSYNEKMDACLYQSNSIELFTKTQGRIEYFELVDFTHGDKLTSFSSVRPMSAEDIIAEAKVREFARKIFSGETVAEADKEVFNLERQ